MALENMECSCIYYFYNSFIIFLELDRGGGIL